MTALTDLLRGKGAHADPVACFDGVTLEQAGRRPLGAEQSIWQLLWHLNYWMDYELRSIRGPEMAHPEHAALGWPADALPPSQSDWGRERKRFGEQLTQLAELASEPALLGRMVHSKAGETVEVVLWQMVAHNSYHIGQVVQLRRAFGAW